MQNQLWQSFQQLQIGTEDGETSNDVSSVSSVPATMSPTGDLGAGASGSLPEAARQQAPQITQVIVVQRPDVPPPPPLQRGGNLESMPGPVKEAVRKVICRLCPPRSPEQILQILAIFKSNPLLLTAFKRQRQQDRATQRSTHRGRIQRPHRWYLSARASSASIRQQRDDVHDVTGPAQQIRPTPTQSPPPPTSM